jgi:hypothetical protein
MPPNLGQATAGILQEIQYEYNNPGCQRLVVTDTVFDSFGISSLIERSYSCISFNRSMNSRIFLTAILFSRRIVSMFFVAGFSLLDISHRSLHGEIQQTARMFGIFVPTSRRTRGLILGQIAEIVISDQPLIILNAFQIRNEIPHPIEGGSVLLVDNFRFGFGLVEIRHGTSFVRTSSTYAEGRGSDVDLGSTGMIPKKLGRYEM